MEAQHQTAAQERSHTTAAAAKCLHHECSCTVTSGEQYCSDYCARASEAEHSKDEHECSCGHLECTHAAAMTPPIVPQIV